MVFLFSVFPIAVSPAGKVSSATNASDIPAVCTARASIATSACAKRAGVVSSATRTSTSAPITNHAGMAARVSTPGKVATRANAPRVSPAPNVRSSSMTASKPPARMEVAVVDQRIHPITHASAQWVTMVSSAKTPHKPAWIIHVKMAENARTPIKVISVHVSQATVAPIASIK